MPYKVRPRPCPAPPALLPVAQFRVLKGRNDPFNLAVVQCHEDPAVGGEGAGGGVGDVSRFRPFLDDQGLRHEERHGRGGDQWTCRVCVARAGVTD